MSIVKLFLGIVGATISFVFLVLEKQNSDNRKILAIVAAIGSLVLIGSASVDYISSKTSEETIQNILKEAEDIGNTTQYISEALATLTNQPIKRLGIKLVDLHDLEENFEGFEKGTPSVWISYFRWLRQTEGHKFLKLTVNANRHYKVPLILLYLLSNENNENIIKPIIETYNWLEFPSESQLKDFETNFFMCEYVLFYNRNDELIGSAKTKSFIRDLLHLKSKELNSLFEKSIYSPEASFAEFAERNIPSFVKTIGTIRDSKELVRKLVLLGENESVTVLDSSPYVFKLTDIIQQVDILE